jgi:hypothetical protein
MCLSGCEARLLVRCRLRLHVSAALPLSGEGEQIIRLRSMVLAYWVVENLYSFGRISVV